ILSSIIIRCPDKPVVYPKIRAAVPERVAVVCQGPIVASSLCDYLRRHPEMDAAVSRGGATRYFTTDVARDFARLAGVFLGREVEAAHIAL
ncbi:MAG: glutamate racemase, partial [Muribaculaceae bacterium]|nr:glutamate racemase [Muribaculaceae bacterium]